MEIKYRKLAIKQVTDMLSVCPETLNENCVNDGYNCRKRNSTYTLLSEVLDILNSKVK